MRRFLTILLVVVAIVLTACTPGQPDNHQSTCRTWNGFRTTFWLRTDDGLAPFEQLTEHASQVCIASPFAYQLEGPGKVTTLIQDDQLKLAQTAQHQGVLLMPTVVDHDAGLTAATLNDPAVTVKWLTDVAVINGYDGLNLDLESISLAVTDDGARDALTDELSPKHSQFVKLLADSLHQAHKLLSVAVMPRSAPDDWAGARFYDYQAIGAAADQVQVMAYDQHWGTGDPGPTAELEWVHNAFMYAIDVAPAGQIPPAKVWVGMPLYGHVYNSEGSHDVLASRLAELTPTGPVTRPDAEVTYVHHDSGQKVDQIVWYNDPCSTLLRVNDLAQQLVHHQLLDRQLTPEEIGGIAFYPLGSPQDVDPGHWEALAGKTKPAGTMTDSCPLPRP
jgi:spore germination protein YaaH